MADLRITLPVAHRPWCLGASTLRPAPQRHDFTERRKTASSEAFGPAIGREACLGPAVAMLGLLRVFWLVAWFCLAKSIRATVARELQ